jgi:DNA-binding response OmpR family regulator
MNEQKTLLCVDDNDDNREILKIFFEQAGYEVTDCSTGEECLDLIKKGEYSAVILDYALPDNSGLKVCAEIKRSVPDTPVIFYTGFATAESRADASDAGADAYLIKPNDLDNIVSVVNNLIEKS